MKSLFIGALIPLSSIAASANLYQSLVVDSCEFDDVYATNPAKCDIVFSNTGNQSINISNFQVVSGKGNASPSEVVVAPRSTVRISIAVDTSESLGRNSYIVTFDTAPESGYRSAKVKGFVSSSLNEASPIMDFGVVNVENGDLKESRLSLSSNEVKDFRILEFIQVPTWLNAKIDMDGKTIEASVKKSASWGLHEDYVRVRINTPNQKEALIKIKADVHGKVVPSENPVDFGVVRKGDKNEATFRINDISGRILKIGKVSVKGYAADATVKSCQPAAEDCKQISVRVSDRQNAGSLKGEVDIDLPDYGINLPVYTWGILIPKSYKIKPLEAERNSSAASNVNNISENLKLATRKKTVVDDIPLPGSGPLLKWSVSDAGGVYGFQVFRADVSTGPFVLINQKLIRADTENNEYQQFQWRDTTAEKGREYYYSIGIVRVNGKKEHLAGPEKVIAK